MSGLTTRVCFGAGIAFGIYYLADLGRRAWCGKDRFAVFLAAALGPDLLLSSLSRPAQRYLLLCLPLVFFDLVVRPGPGRGRAMVWLAVPSLFLFAAMSLFSVTYTAARARARASTYAGRRRRNRSC